MSNPSVCIALLRPLATIPKYATPGSAGMDLSACIDEPFTLHSAQRFAFPTGIAIEIPPGWEGQVRPRSGLARKHGIGMVNAPGTIDSDYIGEVHVLLINLSDDAYTINPGDRIAQLVIAPCARPGIFVVSKEQLTRTERGEGGFGSSGT